MEDVEKPSVADQAISDVKNGTVCEGPVENTMTAIESDVCHKSNGVVEATNTDNVEDAIIPANETTAPNMEVIHESLEEDTKNPSPKATDAGNIPDAQNVLDEVTSDCLPKETPTTTADADIIIVEKPTQNIDQIIEENIIADVPEVEESVVEIDGIVESINDRVTFKTEIVVESNVYEMNENKEDQNVVTDNATNLLNELGQTMELSEMLRSSDTNENVENNNCANKQEVFNKEELLDILEGNDANVECSNKIRKSASGLTPSEQKLALQQLSRLKRPKKRKYEKKHILQRNVAVRKVEENIVTEIVKEWEDDELVLEDQSKMIIEESENLLKGTNNLVTAQDCITKQEEASVRSSLDSTTSDKQTPNQSKSGDEALPQRRLGRIIKKKVIFDPDNPDTFTKGKSSMKSRDSPQEKDQLLIKKIKGDQINQQIKARSPISKLQWKKPPPKNSKRLTEVDKLLMDEGAVNMIYQLTPEAAKGKKNMRTKAEIIKNLQRSTPNSKEMKFRERKKDAKYEDGEPRKIAGSKQRPSLGSSVKSPSVFEDFEAHSADDSIIYRRHSSSSYSSSCMSPRRLSDVDSGTVNNIARKSLQVPGNQDHTSLTDGLTNTNVSANDTFMTENMIAPKKLINKSDCLSIKEKLNSKLSLALNKRKQESAAIEKSKPKKISKPNERLEKHDGVNDYKYLSINIDNRLGEICIKKSGSKYNIEVIKELETALLYLNSRDDISVTLLMSECGNICSGLDLKSLITDSEARTKYAFDLAESIRSLLYTMDQHHKLLCMGVGSSCSSIGLAMLAMSDITMAAECATFVLETEKLSGQQLRNGPLVPGLSVLTLSSHQMSKSLLSDLLVFGHKLSASDALRYGLVSRTLWPERFHEQLRNIAKDIAIQPIQNVMLKKQLLNLKKSQCLGPSLEKERDMLVRYWVSPEGQDLIRAAYETT